MASKYPATMLEEELKLHVAEDSFLQFDCKRKIGKIDFCVDIKASGPDSVGPTPALWAEAKSGTTKDIHESFVQLILTIGRSRTFSFERPPFFLGAFDAEKIAFLPYDSVIDVFTQNDFNWNVTPSNHETKEFKQLYGIVKNTIESKSLLFNYVADAKDLEKFIGLNFKTGTRDVSRIKITRNNFTHIYQKWRNDVLPSLEVSDWNAMRREGIIDADFFLADILSDKDNRTIRQKLFVLLKTDIYEIKFGVSRGGLALTTKIGFNDGQGAHKKFWNRYARPPRQDYWDFIVSRRDLLVDQDVRERKGAFFTPQKWVELSQEYLAKTLGDNWQDEYVVWDCCAGTGNLEAGLTNKYNIWASTLDKADVDVMHTRIKMMDEKCAGGSNLLDSHVFQFDFLNDSFDKLPEGLKKIVNDPEARKKLVIYINPPYAEGDNRVGRGRRISEENYVTRKYGAEIGYGKRELYCQFLARIFMEINGCSLGEFSTLKLLQAPKFNEMRAMFSAELSRLFIVPANTFDNVKGEFPIGFKVWRTGINRANENWPDADVYERDEHYAGTKGMILYDGDRVINDWVDAFGNNDYAEHSIGTLLAVANDFQNQRTVRLCQPNKPWNHQFQWQVMASNVIESCVYLSVRLCIEASWLNDRDQFLYPKDEWRNDAEFVSDCLAYALFHGQNRISSADGPNHWIPFTEAEVGAQDNFASHFMSDFIAGRIVPSSPSVGKQATFDFEGDTDASTVPDKPIEFSPEAKAVLGAGRELWKYYHSHPHANANASYYDIRRHFQGVTVDAKGKEKMNSTSEDATYNALLDALKKAMKNLAGVIKPKVFEYGFLKP